MGDKWIDFPLPDGSYSDDARPWTDQDVVNYLPIRAEAQGPRSKNKFRTAPGLPVFIRLGEGPIRGMHDVEGLLYVVSGNKLYSLTPDGTSAELGDIPGVGRVRMTHNQVAGGNQVVIATRSSAYVYTDEGAVNAGSGGGGGGGGGGSEPPPIYLPALDKYGNTASRATGPNGGFADNSPDPIPQPEVFGADIVGSDGDFTDPSSLDNWRNPDGSALSSKWSIDSGRLRYHGRSTYAIAVHWPSRLRMATQPSVGSIMSVAATVQTDGFITSVSGSTVGATIGADRSAVKDAELYPVDTGVTFDHDYQIDVPGVTAYGAYNLQTAMPCVAVYNPAGDLVTCWWDDFTAEVSDPDVPMTSFVPANIDFPSDDLTGWVTFAGLMDEDIAGGELRATCTDSAGSTRYYINTDEIPVTDVGQRIRIRADVWSNDPTTTIAGENRITANGVALGIALRDSGGNYYYSQYAYVFQRGDWTPREWWQEVTTVAGVTYHAMFAVRAGDGYTGGIRDIEIDYTTDPVTR